LITTNKPTHHFLQVGCPSCWLATRRACGL